MYVNGSKSFQGNQGHVGNQGQVWNNEGKGGNFKKKRPVCTYCGLTGHIANKCYKLHGYPLGYKPKGGNKAMANQITGSFGGFDGLPNIQPCDANQFNIDHQTPFGVSQPNFGGFAGGFGVQNCQQQPQCPISQVQCEQLLNFLKAHTASSSGFGTANAIGTQTASQVASVMGPDLPFTIATSSPTAASALSSSSNFSGNPFWIAPHLSHSIFSIQVIDRHYFKSNSWILDTGATDHMVHSVSQLTTITYVVHSCVYLPNGEKVVVTHIGTVLVITKQHGKS